MAKLATISFIVQATTITIINVEGVTLVLPSRPFMLIKYWTSGLYYKQITVVNPQ